MNNTKIATPAGDSEPLSPPFVVHQAKNMREFFRIGGIAPALRGLGALSFLCAVALVPIIIVAFFSSRGGIWVAGYVTGMVTAPIIALGALRAIGVLNDLFDLDIPISFVVFGILVTLTSVAAALWSFFA